MKKGKSASPKSNEPSSIIQLGVIFVVVAALALVWIAGRLY